MKKLAFLAAAGFAVAASAIAYDPSAARDTASLARFKAEHIDAPATPPFAFLYGGRPSSGLLSRWPAAASSVRDGRRTVTTVVYADPATRLKVTVLYTLYDDFPAVEWVIRFRNDGKADSPILEGIQAASLKLDGGSAGPATLHRALGSDAARTDFAPIAEVLADGAASVFGPKGGRSSDTALPFFNIASPGRGVLVAIGWTGRWKAVVRKIGPTSIGLEAGMERTRFRLHPGEEVRSPSMALLFWRGPDRLEGHNLFRRFLRAYHTPRPGGRPVEAPLSHGVGFGGPAPCTEYVCATERYALAMMDRLVQFGLEPDAFWIDAGWYEGARPTWWEGVGSWTPDPARFPRGLKPIGDAARNRGRRFVLWFEPERAYEGSRLDREHPEWLIRLPGVPDRVFNLGNPQARAWLIDHVSNLLLTEGVTVYRQDININLAPYWRTLDAPDRVGIAEIRHIEGLYAYWDALLARVPGLLIDNCAGGGRRLDLETVGRSLPLWRTDSEPCEPEGEQCHTYGLQLYLPYSGTGNNDPRKYAFRSAMCGPTVLAWDVNAAAFDVAAARADLAEHRALRPYFAADYYPLTEHSTSSEAWAAFQWNRPEEGDGIVLTFRRRASAEDARTVALHGLEPDADYEVAFEDYGLAVVRKGRELMSGLGLKIPQPAASLLVRYRRLP